MKKIQQEYLLKTTLSILFNRLSSASGLSEWFADDVIFEGEKATFFWGGLSQKAEILKITNNVSILFRWFDAGDEAEFGFTINEDELTGELALIITDHIEEGEEKDAIRLWNSQILKLKQSMGSPEVIA